MKLRYLICIIVLLLVYATIVFLLKGHLENNNWITISVTLGIAFAALINGVIALSNSDKPPRFVKFNVAMEVNKEDRKTHNPEEQPNEFKKKYDNKPIYSYQVYFKIKNKSNFTLKRPVFTFHLPDDLMHPHKDISDKWIPYYRTNLYNVQIDLRTFQYEDTFVLSNCIIPNLNNEQEMPIWIRMCLLKDDTKNREVYVELNCDNAEGATKKIEIIPKKLLEY